MSNDTAYHTTGALKKQGSIVIKIAFTVIEHIKIVINARSPYEITNLLIHFHVFVIARDADQRSRQMRLPKSLCL